MDSICDFCNLMVTDGEYRVCEKCEATFCSEHGEISSDEEPICADCEE